jgi:hypothetical protein
MIADLYFKIFFYLKLKIFCKEGYLSNKDKQKIDLSGFSKIYFDKNVILCLFSL